MTISSALDLSAVTAVTIANPNTKELGFQPFKSNFSVTLAAAVTAGTPVASVVLAVSSANASESVLYYLTLQKYGFTVTLTVVEEEEEV